MHRLLFLICAQFVVFSGLFANGCPSPIVPLPGLPVPAVVPPPSSTCPTPVPTTVANYLPFTFVNNTGLSADEIYVLVLVNSSTQYLSFNDSSPNLATLSDFTPSTYISASQYSYQLSYFEEIDTNTYTFYIPNTGNNGIPGSNYMVSSRVFISLKQPLTYFINNLGILQFPTEFDVTNDNYYTLNDKFEFDLGSNALNRLNLNLTGVDFFGLPLLVQANYLFFYGSTYTPYCATTGMPASVTLDDVFTQYNTALSSLSSPFDDYWGTIVATYTNPNGGSVCNLRIFAPATAMGSTQTQANPSPISFPINYFLNTASSPATCTWFNAVWSGTTAAGNTAFYQKTNPTPGLILDATTKSGSATAVGKEVGDQSFRFEIKGGADDGNTLIFPSPTSSKAFFTGAASDYKPAITGSASAATLAQVFKVFATLIIGGITPIDCMNPTQFTINGAYVQNNSANYFQNNADLTSALSTCPCLSNVPWWDFYSRTLLTIGTPNLFYTSAYSDFLGTDGTIVIVNPNTNNAAATITVNLGDASTNINYPNPYSDTTMYTYDVGIPANTTVLYGTSPMGPWNPIPSSVTAQANQIFLQVTYASGDI